MALFLTNLTWNARTLSNIVLCDSSSLTSLCKGFHLLQTFKRLYQTYRLNNAPASEVLYSELYLTSCYLVCPSGSLIWAPQQYLGIIIIIYNKTLLLLLLLVVVVVVVVVVVCTFPTILLLPLHFTVTSFFLDLFKLPT